MSLEYRRDCSETTFRFLCAVEWVLLSGFLIKLLVNTEQSFIYMKILRKNLPSSWEVIEIVARAENSKEEAKLQGH